MFVTLLCLVFNTNLVVLNCFASDIWPERKQKYLKVWCKMLCGNIIKYYHSVVNFKRPKVFLKKYAGSLSPDTTDTTLWSKHFRVTNFSSNTFHQIFFFYISSVNTPQI